VEGGKMNKIIKVLKMINNTEYLVDIINNVKNGGQKKPKLTLEDFANEMHGFVNEMRCFVKEMRDFKQEVRDNFARIENKIDTIVKLNNLRTE
jgi:Rod binding domain-containing protein